MVDVFYLYLFISFSASLTQSLTCSQKLLVRKLTSFQILHRTYLFISVSLCVVDFISLHKGDVLSYTPMSLWLQSLLHRYCIVLQASCRTSQWGSHTDKPSPKTPHTVFPEDSDLYVQTSISISSEKKSGVYINIAVTQEIKHCYLSNSEHWYVKPWM